MARMRTTAWTAIAILLLTWPIGSRGQFRWIQLSDLWNSDIGSYKSSLAPNAPVDGTSKVIDDGIQEFLSHIKAEDPDFVVVCGDLVGGRWWGNHKEIAPFGPATGALPVIEKYAAQAASVYYPYWVSQFKQAGLEVHTLPGDHEYGDNPERWNDKSRITTTIVPKLRQLYAQYTAELVPKGASRPVGTPQAETSYAFRHKGAQFVVLDVFDYEYATTAQFGRFGAFFGFVGGKHLQWVERVLSEAYADPSVSRIFVFGHTPILAYTNAQYSSQLAYRDRPYLCGRQSWLWKLFETYHVDVYFAGEIHAINMQRCGPVAQSIINDYYWYADKWDYAVVDVTPEGVEITVKSVPTKRVPNRTWSPTDGFKDYARVPAGGPIPQGTYTTRGTKCAPTRAITGFARSADCRKTGAKCPFVGNMAGNSPDGKHVGVCKIPQDQCFKPEFVPSPTPLKPCQGK